MPETSSTPFDRTIDRYQSKVAQGLWALAPGYRHRILRDIRADLLDLAEDQGFRGESDLDAYLRTQQPPREIAHTIQKEELEQAFWRILLALIPMLLAGLWTLISRPQTQVPTSPQYVQQVLWFACLTYLQFAVREAWARQREPWRLLWGTLLGGLGGFAWFVLRLDIWPTLLGDASVLMDLANRSGVWILKGAFLGFTVERVAVRRRWWVLALDVPLYMLLTTAHAKAMQAHFAPRPAAVAKTAAAPRREPGRSMVAMRMTPPRPIPRYFLPVTIGLQAFLWAGARTTRRIEIFRLFSRKIPVHPAS